jgi:ATP phosphoribosyltransferase regulatory subunit
MKMIETPSGLRDLTGAQAEKRSQLQQKVEAVFANAGYQQIVTPDIEFYQTYARAYASLKESQMYKFFDQDGQILTLRTDMTVPIARVAASKYRDEKPPFRFYYGENVYKVRQSFAGKRNEVRDCGIELIGEDSQSDPEVLNLADEVLAALGLSNYILEIGNSDFFRLAARLCGLSKEDTDTMADLVDRKAMPDLHAYTGSLSLSDAQAAFFRQLPLLSGKEECLEKAKTLCFDSRLEAEVERMEDLGEMMKRLDGAGHIAYDLGKVPHLDYYTGIIFEAFTPGAATAILSGGRYDDLLKKFGRDLPACGFGIKLDYLLDLFPDTEQKMRRLRYPKGQIEAALQKAKQLRKDGPVMLEAADVEQMEVVL